MGAVSNGTFAFKLSSEGSELYLGGTNSSLYIGDVEPHPVIGDGFWHIQGASTIINSHVINSNFSTIIDTGTTIMYGPPDDVASFYKAIPGSQLFDEVNGYYSYPCNNPSTIAIAWGGKEWVISSDK